MKKLTLKNEQYRNLESEFTSYLKTAGYSKSSIYNLPTHLRGYLHWQEQREKRFEDWQMDDYKLFMETEKLRKNERRGGGLSAAYLNKIIQALQLFQRFLQATDRQEAQVRIKHETQLSSDSALFSRSEIALMRESCGSDAQGLRLRAILALCYGCGLRRSEAEGLNLSDIWWERSLLQVRRSKMGKSRLVPITRALQEDLEHYLEHARPRLLREAQTEAFLLSVRGERLSSAMAYSSLQQLLQELKLARRGLHSLRHSIASHLAESGMSSEQIARFLGHSSLDSTQIYVHSKQNKNERK